MRARKEGWLTRAGMAGKPEEVAAACWRTAGPPACVPAAAAGLHPAPPCPGACSPKALRMKKGNWPERSTPADVVSVKRLRLLGQAATRLRTDTKSVCSGLLPPSQLRAGVGQRPRGCWAGCTAACAAPAVLSAAPPIHGLLAGLQSAARTGPACCPAATRWVWRWAAAACMRSPPFAGEGCGAGAAADGVHARQRRRQAGRVPQVGDGGAQPRGIAKLLPHLVGAARKRAHLVAALQAEQGSRRTGRRTTSGGSAKEAGGWAAYQGCNSWNGESTRCSVDDGTLGDGGKSRHTDTKGWGAATHFLGPCCPLGTRSPPEA